MFNKEDVYVVNAFNGKVFNGTLFELIKQFKLYNIRRLFGYVTDFGKFKQLQYVRDDNQRYGFRYEHVAVYKYQYFCTTPDGKLIHPEQLIADYCLAYDPTNYHYTQVHVRRWNRSHHKRKNSRTYRAMKTTSELRQVHAVLKDEGEPEFRGNRRNLPCKWDDYWIYYQRSWKTQSKRKRQYKGS